jgi:Holliday junction resolvase RusA-like endonuclease
MGDAITFSLAGLPRGQGRPRATARGGIARLYKDAKSRAYEKSIATVAAGVMAARKPLTGALSVSARFRMPIPKSATKRDKAAMAAGEVPHTSKPDGTNMLKACEDAMNGIVFVDDSQIVRGFFTKVYSEKPGVDLRIEALEPQDQ